ncbi:aldehyde dehydrogenase family protein [Sphingomonas flavalba]|uniref:aldehyde dehydrogenase family protein n=1 Tax=Sphingomonas flavalba TaxID=2559804 RepID=UPI00109E1806|nr:aldehyde dehydrogenase family protein [Sphingomonas flavalba]
MTTANDLSLLSAKAAAFISGEKALFIDGEWRPAETGETLPVIDPSSGREVGRIAQAGAADVDAAVRAARRGLEDSAWARMRPHRREEIMLRLAELIGAEAQALAEIETVNSGKLISNTRLFDADLSVHTLRYMAGWATKLHGETMDLSVPYLPDVRFNGFTRRFPIGVVAAITPWNVPLCQAVWKLAPVLATGCTLVLKPSEFTSLTALRLAELCDEAGVPPGVVNVVTGVGEVTGKALVEHPGVDKISFTGSTRVGLEIAAQAASTFKSYNLELGGKSPLIIAEDADLEKAIPGAAWAIYGNSGQNCCAGSRALIHARHFDRVVAGVADIAASVRLGPGLDPASMMGPLVRDSHRARVAQHVERARAAGAQVIGGESVDGAGSYFTPAVITGLDHTHPTVQQEIFGPVLCAFAFRDDDEALRIANDTRFGLGASIWTEGLQRANRYFERLKAGTVWINTHNILDLALPFGGTKESGVGFELGREGVFSHTVVRAGVMPVAD